MHANLETKIAPQFLPPVTKFFHKNVSTNNFEWHHHFEVKRDFTSVALSRSAYKYREVKRWNQKLGDAAVSQMRLEDSSSEHHWTFSASKDRMKVKVSPTIGLLNRVLLRLFDKTFDIWATNITPSRQEL